MKSSIVTSQRITALWQEQMQCWEMARLNFDAVANASKRAVEIDGTTVWLQYNPGRMASVKSRAVDTPPPPQACFLCHDNRPKEQLLLEYAGEYEVLVNPYPIFATHFTIAACEHTPQRIAGRMRHMLELTQACSEYTFFYNGARCGASAPMHMHFQACNPGCMPIEQQWREACRKEIVATAHARVERLSGVLRSVLIVSGSNMDEMEALCYRAIEALPAAPGEEPMMNIVTRHEAGEWIVFVFPRAQHRPTCYYAEGEAQYLISPGSVEMGGLIITPRQEDYDRITAATIAQIYREVSLDEDQLERICNKI